MALSWPRAPASGRIGVDIEPLGAGIASYLVAMALMLAKQFRGEIISVDSMQVYRGMDIGTAKLPVAERPFR